MTNHPAPDRMALPPPIALGSGGASAAYRVAHASSATAFVARVILVAIAIVLAATLVAMAPQTVLIPLAVVLVGGLAASAILVINDRMRTDRRPARRSARPTRRYNQRPSVPFDATSMQPARRAAHAGRRGSARGGVTGVATLGAVSLTLLVLALVAPAGLQVALAAGGLVGLAVVRLSAPSRVWTSHGVAPSVPAGRPPALRDANRDVAFPHSGESP